MEHAPAIEKESSRGPRSTIEKTVSGSASLGARADLPRYLESAASATTTVGGNDELAPSVNRPIGLPRYLAALATQVDDAGGGALPDVALHPWLASAAEQERRGAGVPISPELAAGLARRATDAQPVESSVRTEMESLLGADLRDVRLHTGSWADRQARKLSARAMAAGRHILFDSSVGDPHGHDRPLLEHELAHVASGASVQNVQLYNDEPHEEFTRRALELIPGDLSQMTRKERRIFESFVLRGSIWQDYDKWAKKLDTLHGTAAGPPLEDIWWGWLGGLNVRPGREELMEALGSGKVSPGRMVSMVSSISRLANAFEWDVRTGKFQPKTDYGWELWDYPGIPRERWQRLHARALIISAFFRSGYEKALLLEELRQRYNEGVEENEAQQNKYGDAAAWLLERWRRGTRCELDCARAGELMKILPIGKTPFPLYYKYANKGGWLPDLPPRFWAKVDWRMLLARYNRLNESEMERFIGTLSEGQLLEQAGLSLGMAFHVAQDRAAHAEMGHPPLEPSGGEEPEKRVDKMGFNEKADRDAHLNSGEVANRFVDRVVQEEERCSELMGGLAPGEERGAADPSHDSVPPIMGI